MFSDPTETIAKNGFDGMNQLAAKPGGPLTALLLLLRSSEKDQPQAAAPPPS
jgi:hypothetical protein